MISTDGRICAVLVPSDARDFKVSNDPNYWLHYLHRIHYPNDGYLYTGEMELVEIPKGKWKIIGLHAAGNELSEEQKQMVLPKPKLDNNGELGYWDYMLSEKAPLCKRYSVTIDRSFDSWCCKHQMYITNPYEDKEEDDDGNFFGLVDAVIHRQAQQRTGNWLILLNESI